MLIYMEIFLLKLERSEGWVLRQKMIKLSEKLEFGKINFINVRSANLKQKINKFRMKTTVKSDEYAQEFYARKKSLKLSQPFILKKGFPLSWLKSFMSLAFFPSALKTTVGSRSVIAAVLILIALFGGLVVANKEKMVYAVLINGKQVAFVENREEAEQVLNGLKTVKTKAWKRSVTIKEAVTFRETTTHFYNIESISDLTKIFDEKLTFVAAATGIKINGTVGLIVKDKQTADYILDKLKKHFIKNEMNVGSVKFAEKVEIVQVPVDLKDIIEPDKALEIIKNGQQKKATHVVSKGDSLWSIARKYDMRVADLKVANLDLKGEKLDIGQVLNLVRLEPMINVLVERQITVNEIMPYDVVVKKDDGMWRGRQKIQQKGENGSRLLTYKVVMKNGLEISKSVLAEKVLKPAKEQIVLKGSRFVIASRQGSGRLGWPISGKINSSYGRRWGRMHTGLDIDGSTGQPIGAAADGRVVSAGWDGGYGKAVVINHGNGMVTKYAHMSKIEVEVGQQVSRGDLIGLVGSTGNSTGPHVHFEVFVDGAIKNPMMYLK